MPSRLALASALAIVLAPALLPAASAAPEPLGYGVPPNRVVPYVVVERVSLPHTPVSLGMLEVPDVLPPIEIGPFDAGPVCLLDDSLRRPAARDDLVPCELHAEVNLTSPCEGARDTIERAPVVGSAAGDGLNEAIGQLDSRGPEVERQVEDALEEDVLVWDGRAAALVGGCAGSVAAMDAFFTLGRQALAPTGDAEEVAPCVGPPSSPVCAGSFNPQEAFADLEEVSAGGETYGLAGRACTFDGVAVSCGTVPLGEGETDPLASTRTLNENLPGDGSASATIDELATSLPVVGQTVVDLWRDSVAACVLPGLEDGSYGEYSFVVVLFFVEGEGEWALPKNPQNQLLPYVEAALSAWNEASLSVLTLLVDTHEGVVTTVEAAWLFEEGGSADADPATMCVIAPPTPPAPPSIEGLPHEGA